MFFGTSNEEEFLKDMTGNRRFWPVDVGVQPRLKLVWEDLENEVDQIWAEAMMRWRMGESLILSGDLEKDAMQEQESHREVSSKEGIILDFVDQPVPEDWQKWPLDKRRLFLISGIRNPLKSTTSCGPCPDGRKHRMACVSGTAGISVGSCAAEGGNI